MRKQKIGVITKERHGYYGKWYYPAMRELLGYYKFKDNYKSLSKKLRPQISVAQAREAIRVLDELKFIVRDKKGYYKQVPPPFITSGKNPEIKDFHKSMGKLALKALYNFPINKRNFSTLTCTLSEKSFTRAVSKIKALRREILKMSENDVKVDRVYEINVQMFPLT